MNPRIDICRVSFEQIVGDFRTITVIRVSIGGLKLDWSRMRSRHARTEHFERSSDDIAFRGRIEEQ